MQQNNHNVILKFVRNTFLACLPSLYNTESIEGISSVKVSKYCLLVKQTYIFIFFVKVYLMLYFVNPLNATNCLTNVLTITASFFFIRLLTEQLVNI